MLYGIGQSLLSSLAEISVSTVTVFSLDIGYCSSSLEMCLLNIEITLACGLYRRIHNHSTSSDSKLKVHYILSWKDTAKNQSTPMENIVLLPEPACYAPYRQERACAFVPCDKPHPKVLMKVEERFYFVSLLSSPTFILFRQLAPIHKTGINMKLSSG